MASTPPIAAPGGQQCHVARIRGCVGVRVKRDGTPGSGVDGLQVRVAVHPQELGVRRRPWRLDDAAPLFPCGGDAGHHFSPFDPLRMAWRGTMIAESIGVNQDE